MTNTVLNRAGLRSASYSGPGKVMCFDEFVISGCGDWIVGPNFRTVSCKITTLLLPVFQSAVSLTNS